MGLIQCPDCKLVATEDDVAQNSNACPGCERPFAHQPGPILDEMEHGLRGMPTSTMDDMSGNPLTEGTLGDWQNRGVRDESFASSVRTSEFALPGLEQPQPETRFDSRYPTHHFLIHADGSVYDAPYPTGHEEIASTLGNAKDHLGTGSLGRLFGTGEAAFVSNGSKLSADELGKALGDHYGRPIEVDPNDPGLKVRSQEERFGLTPSGVGPELQSLYSPAKPRVGPRQPTPGENEGLIRGGKTAELSEVPMETTQVALPGQHTEEVPVNGLGLHSDVIGALSQLGAYVNGQPVSDPAHATELQKHWSGSTTDADSEWEQNRGQPIMLSHYDPKMLDLAKQVVTRGDSTPVRNLVRDKEAGHQATIQIPHGITDNLHRTLGNLQAWVENPYDNGQLRPYYNKYWKSIRPKFQSPGAINVGVSDPQMAEIINHVAQRDDLSPLYKYRGVKTSLYKQAWWPLAGLAARALPFLMRGAMGAGAEGAAGQVGKGMMMGNMVGQMMPGQAQQTPAQQQPVSPAIESPSFFTHTIASGDYESPGTHPEFPKVEDADTHQRNDGDSGPNISDDVNDIGGTDTGPNGLFPEDGAGVERFLSLLPLVMHYFNSEESGASDPMIDGLHKSLDMEVPGYQDQPGDEDAANQLIMMIMGGDEGVPQQDEDTNDDTSNEHDNPEDKDRLRFEERVSWLPHISIVPPGIPGFSAPIQPSETPAAPAANTGMIPFPSEAQPPPGTTQGACPQCGGNIDPANTNCPQCGSAALGLPNHPLPVTSSIVDQSIINGPVSPEEEALQTSSWPEAGKPQYCPHCQSPTNIHLGVCPHCGEEVFPNAEAQMMQRSAADNQGPNTDEQKSAVARLLREEGRGEEVEIMIVQPWLYADELARITGTDTRPEGDTQGGQPEPAMEEAPPGDTMPVPGMSTPDQQMMGAVQRYSTPHCPSCESHTTSVFGEDGHSKCHSCKHVWKPEQVVKSITAFQGDNPMAEANPEGIPIADQEESRDISQEQDSGHTWIDEGGSPLIKGQEYKMYSAKYDIPDRIRVEAVKPDAITYTIVGEYGLEHSTELDHEEADIEGTTFVPVDTEVDTPIDDDLGMETNNDDNTAYEGSPESTDLSRPHALVSASANDEEELDPRRAWIFQGGIEGTGRPPPTWESKTSGAKFTPHEQRQFIDERGTARNADKLNLSGTHYEDEATDDNFILGW